MSWKIGMPNLGHTMEEGKVTEWLKRVGDSVRKGEVIAIVETEKASFDVESPADGMLLLIEADGGSVVPVGGTIGVVGEQGEVVDTPARGSALARDAQRPSSAGAESSGPVASAAAPAAKRLAISPAARALAEELGVDVREIVGTGEGGMISRDDVRAAAAGRMKTAAPADLATPFSPMRRAIARATAQAWQTIPQVALFGHADVEALVARQGSRLTAAIGKASALALLKHRSFNGWLIDDGFKASSAVNLGVAISTPDGLVTAMVPRAETRSVEELHQEIAGLAADARSGNLDGGRMIGSSFTISSLGRWKVDAFTPIISAPQVAILGVGQIERVARETADGGVRFTSVIGLTLVFDHRANDGVEAAQLLASIVELLEHPERLETKS